MTFPKNSFYEEMVQDATHSFTMKIGGTTFDRPDFRRMEAMIEAGQVSTVIVKDLSRFGRNYLEAGQYLEIKYPTLGVRFMTMTADYEAEQRSLKASVADAEEKLAQANQGKTDLRMLLKGIREFSEVKQLTPEIVNTLIQRIEVHNNDKSSGHCYVKVDIYFTAIGMFSPPSEEELAAEMVEYAQTVGA